MTRFPFSELCKKFDIAKKDVEPVRKSILHGARCDWTTLARDLEFVREKEREMMSAEFSMWRHIHLIQTV